MATYTYQCADCGNVFDIEASIQEKEEGKSQKFACPKCQSKNIKQDFSAGNLLKNIFTGGKDKGGCCSGRNDAGGSCCG